MPNQNTGSGQLVRKVNARHDAAFKILEEHASRESLAGVLGISDDARLVKFVGFLLSPNAAVQRRSLAKLAQMCELSYAELLRAISQSRVSEGILRMSAKVPEVMESVAKNACNREVSCLGCKGTGEIIDRRHSKRGQPTAYRTCPTCRGTGTVIERGDIDAQKIVFESVGLTNRKSPLFNVNLNRDRPGELPSLESEMGGLGKVLDVRPAKSA